MVDWNPRANEVFVAALQADPDTRHEVLDRACAGDTRLRAEVEAMLQAHEQAGEFLDQPHPAAPRDGTGRTEDYRSDVIETPGTIIAGKYKLLQKIGEGGMGSVWMADQTEPVKRRVAVKLIRTEREGSRSILSRFEAERQAIALMDHPHIAKLLDAGAIGRESEALARTSNSGLVLAGASDSRTPYFVMELVKGIPLNDYCDQHKLSITDRLKLFMQICSAVQHAHQKGIIHRDLKPSNVLVESHDGKPVPKVIDFGLAKALSGQPLTENTLFTALGTVAGTPLYMAPEQAMFNAIDVDTRADIYALGVILYELLTGSTPIEREQLKKAAFDEILRVIRENEPEKPSKRLSRSGLPGWTSTSPGEGPARQAGPSVAANRQMEPAKLSRYLRGDLDWIVMKALSKERDRRYETANGFARDVERFLNNEPVVAGPPTASYRLRKFVKRNKGPVIAAGLVASALVIGVVGTTWGMIWAVGERNAKEVARQDAAAAAEQERLAKEAEKTAKEESQKRLAQIERGVELFAEMLTGINPRAEEQGGDPLYVQLRQKAEMAAAELNAAVVGDPLAVARLQSILGNTLRELGSNETGIALLHKARALRESELGAEHPATLGTLHDLAAAYLHAGKLREAIQLFEQVRDVRVAKLGTDHPHTLTTLHNLAGAYCAVGNSREGIKLFEQVRDTKMAKLGADHHDTLNTLNDLAVAYQESGHLSEAIHVLHQVRDAKIVTLGIDHPDTLITCSNLATAYQAAGDAQQAIRLLAHVRDAQVAKLGIDHSSTLTTCGNLALAYLSVGRLPEAIKLLEHVRDSRVAKWGTGHPSTLTALHNLAGAYFDSGNLPEAIKLFEQARHGEVTKLGIDHPRTLTTLANLARAYQAAGRVSEAIPLYEQAASGIATRGFLHQHAKLIITNTFHTYESAQRYANAETWRRKWLAVVKERSGPNSPAYAAELAGLGLNLLQQKKWIDAEPVLRESLAIREKQEPDAWTTSNTMSLLGGTLVGRVRSASKDEPAEMLREAERLLLKGYEGLKAREKSIPPQGAARIPEAIDRLIELYTDTNKPEEVKKWQALKQTAQAIEPKQEQLTTLNQKPLFDTHKADELIAEGKHAEAIQLLTKEYDDRKAKLGADHRDTAAALHRLGRAYLNSGEANVAIKLLEETVKSMRVCLGEAHPDELAARMDLAKAYQAAGMHANALALFEETLHLRKVKLGPDHPHTLASMNYLGEAYLITGKLDKALPLLEQTFDLMRRNLGPEHPLLSSTMSNLATTYLSANKVDEAVRMLNGLIDRRRQKAGANDLGFAAELGRVATELLRARQYDVAEKYLRESLAIREKKEPDAWTTFNTMSQLGGAMVGRVRSASKDEPAKLLASAEPLLLKSYEGMKARADKMPPRAKEQLLREAIERLVQLYEAMGKPDEVAKWTKELSALHR